LGELAFVPQKIVCVRLDFDGLVEGNGRGEGRRAGQNLSARIYIKNRDSPLALETEPAYNLAAGWSSPVARGWLFLWLGWWLNGFVVSQLQAYRSSRFVVYMFKGRRSSDG